MRHERILPAAAVYGTQAQRLVIATRGRAPRILLPVANATSIKTAARHHGAAARHLPLRITHQLLPSMKLPADGRVVDDHAPERDDVIQRALTAAG